MIWIEVFFNGLMLGGLYALFGLGLSLIFGVMKIANIAHGELVIAGAFMAFSVIGIVPLPLWVLLPLVAILMFCIGFALQFTLINRVMSDDPMPPLLLTFGLSIIVQNLFVELYGANNRALDPGAFGTASIDLGVISIGVLPLCTFALTVGLFIALQWVLSHTSFGRTIRATSDDPEMVGMMGVDRRIVFASVMAISALLAAIAGMLLTMRTSVTPFSGVERLLIAFEVVVIGGLGSLRASLIGGLVLGVVHAVAFRLDPASGLLYGHILLLIILLVRPEGLVSRSRLR